MRLSQQAIDDFKKIYLKEYGVLLDDEKANDLAVNFLRLFEIVTWPQPSSYPQSSEKPSAKPLTDFNGTLTS
jgi:hypothetical protein